MTEVNMEGLIMPIKDGFTVDGVIYCYNPADRTITGFIEKRHTLHDCDEKVLEALALGKKNVTIIVRE